MFKNASLPISFGLLVMASAVCAQESNTPILAQIAEEGQSDGPDVRDQASAAPNEKSAEDLARELSNPNSPLASLTFKQTYTSFDGDLPGAGDQSSNVSLFQPVFPFPLGDSGDTNLFIRPAFAYVWRQPVYDPVTSKFSNKSGWADVGFDVAVGRTLDDGLVVVGGVQGTIPTNTDVSGGQWRLGPEFVVAKIGQKGFWAAFPSHQWDIGGDNYDYSTSGLELFGGIYLPNAWTISTDSKWSYDWVNDQATIPINLTVRKVVKFGKLPLSFQAGIDYYVESNDDFGQDWAINFSVAPVVPNFIYNAIRR
ncbi:hypothetical protein [Tropicimonas sp. IMCC6043]|uniref:hypothetical protein n=1 Tax=Tropicimonas sp. IMCC6043 TaxID=2510645 RepID=UPI00101CE93A|nr:hypothetical protein [Tropicimonas sp. IMCC6043]RYH06924.1 hypothetical protein EU800_22090 [Tropicimonas sp. IMCC6043]